MLFATKMKKRYEIIEHKADLKIRVWAKNLPELFENAMIGMFEGAGYKKIPKSQKRKIKIEIKSPDLFSLLVDFLSELIYLSETKKLVFYKATFEKLDEKNLKGVLFAKPLQEIETQIKGVTYHNLEIKKNDFWQAIILFDV